MRSNIIKKGTADEVRCAVTELRLSETFMGVPQLSVKVVSPVTVDIEIGDYIVYDYNGVTYTLREMPGREKHARPSTYGGAFVYNLVFHGPEWDLRNAPFLDLVLYDNGQHFTSMPDVTTYEDVYGIAARVQANMDNMYPGKWEIRVVSGLSADSTLAQKLSETQDFSLSDGKCLDALSQVYSQWGVSFVYSYEGGKHVITIGGAETQEDTTGLFMYGRGNGLKVIKSSVQNASEIATRYYVYGGTQNMQPRYYNGRTMEPEYIHASDASNPTVTAICSGRRLLGDNMYVPNLMIPVSKWGRTTWYVWTASSHSQAVFTEVRNPSAGDDFAFDEPNIGASRNVISSVSSDSIVVGGVTYQYLTEVLYPDIRKAHIDAPQSYLDKYGIRPATLRFDGSGEREDIHPSIKGLTIGDIRAGLGSGAEYYPSASVYTDPDERVDEVLSCDNPQDDGLTSSGANKYESSSSIAVAAVEKEFELALSNRAGNKIYTLGGRGSYYVLSEGAQFQVQYDGVLNARIPIQFSLATEGRDDRIHCRAGVKVNKTTSSGVESVIGSSVDEKAVVDLSTIDMDLSVDISGVSVQSGDTISVDIELYTLTTKSHDKVTVNIEAFTARYNIAISLGTDFYIKLKQIGFDISEVPTNDGESPVISMTSGQCGGYEFEIHDVSYNASDDSWTLRCARVQDGTLGQWFPNSIFKIEPDDTFVLLNIALPEVYITANEQRLYDAALAERLYEERPLLEPEIDSKVMAESPQVLRAGMWFSVKDTDLGLADADGGSYLILIDSVEVTDKPDTIRSFKVTLRNNKEDNVFVRMQRQIAQTSASVQSERRSQTKTSVSEVPTKGGGGGEYVDTSDFVTLSTDQTITGRKTFANDVVFGGEVSGGVFGSMFVPSTEGPGKYALVFDSASAVDGEIPTETEGLDVDAMWKELSGSAGSQVIAKEHLPSDAVYDSDLAGYATQAWVQHQGYATQSDLDGRINDLINGAPAAYDTLKEIADVLEGNVDSIGDILTALGGKADRADTLAGYGITDAYTKNEIDGLLEGYVTLATPQTITGAKTFSGDVVLGGGGARAFLPSTAGAGIYSIVFDAESAVDGEVPTESGIDMAAVWTALGTEGEQQIDASHLSGALASYVTQAALSSGLATKVDKVAGMGLSSNDFTDALLAKLNGIEAGANRYVLPTASSAVLGGVRIGANISISDGVISTHAPYVHPTATERNIEAAAGRVLSAIVVNSLGHVTSVSYKALAAADIPQIPKSKISDFPTTWAWSGITGTPTTLAGYGITDGFNIVQVKGDGNAVSNASWQGHTLTLTRSTTFVDISSEQTISGKKIFSGDAVFGSGSGRLFLPSTSGAGIYSLVFDDGSAVDGETPSGVGLDAEAMWQELGGSVSSKVIAIEHIPSIPTFKITGLSDYVWNILVTPGTLAGPKISASHLPPLSDLSGNLDSSRITGLDNALSGYVSSVTTSGAGNAVTGYAKSGNTLTLKKDLTFLTSVPKATSSAYGGIKIGYPESGKNYPVELDSSGRAYVSVPWVNTTYSLSSFGITATAEEINKLDGVGTLLHSGNYTSYTYPTTVAKISDLHSSWDSILTTSGVRSRSMTFNGTDYPCYTAAANTSNITWYAPTTAGSSGQWLKSTGGTPTWANDGSGSGLDADLLDGTHKSGLLTALTSNATTNLSLTVGGTVKSVADLYATYLGGETLAETRRGMSFLTSSFSAAGWYRVFTSTSVNTSYVSEVLLHIGRNYYSPQNEHYSFSICVGYNGDISITQLSGVMGGHLITKIRVVWDNTQKFYIDIYSAASSYNNAYGVTGQGYGTFSAFTSGATIPDGYTAYEFATVDGCKSDRGFTGALSGNATSATKLQTSRTLWGQSFNGMGNVSGDMTGVGSITGATFGISGTICQMFLYNNTSKNDKRLTLYSQSNYAAIYNITADGSAFSDLVLGNNSNALYYDASAARWGIGTSSPAYKLDVAGTLRATGQGAFDTIKITDNTSAAHLTFGRTDNFNYISLPGNSSTLAVAPGGTISGAGSALCISNSATYPGYHNGTISLGTSSYRWSNIYSVLGSFSGLLTADSIAVTDKLYLPSPDGNQRYYIKFE